ncbi:MAG: hypothetical protein ABIT96_05400 [Ferruginibacter sp.]
MNYIKIFLLLFACSAMFSCKKDKTTNPSYTCTTCKQTPDALAANDGSSKGIYKGAVVGSTGTISFNVLNDGTTITARMVLDGIVVNLTSTLTWQAGQPYVAPFTGTLNGAAVSITFSVAANGGSPIVTSSSIPGHPGTQFTLVKETSNSLIEVFEGTYHTTRPEDGTFNMLLSRSARVYGGQSRKSTSTSSTDFNGTLTTDNKLKDPNGNILGTLNADAINGTFNDGNGNTVTITARRTL